MPLETQSASTCTAHFVVEVNKKLWVGSGLFKNCNFLFGTRSTVFGSESFDHTDQIALRDDAAGCSHALVGWGGIGVTQLSCKMFGTTVQFLAKFD